MVSRKTPNHSKPNEEPVTIDLEAEKTAQDAAPENLTERSHEEPGGSSTKEGEVPLEADKEPLRDEAQESIFASAPQEPQAAAAHEADPRPSHAEQAPHTEGAPSHAGSTSGLIAAGIVGGLIALIGAGALQYAGFLPGGRASKGNSAEIAALNAQIDGLKQSVANLAAAPAAKPDATLAARVAALETSVAHGGASGSGGAANAASDQKIASLTGEVEQLKADLSKATQSQASSDAEVSKRLDDAEKKLSGPSQESAVARAIAAASAPRPSRDRISERLSSDSLRSTSDAKDGEG